MFYEPQRSFKASCTKRRPCRQCLACYFALFVGAIFLALLQSPEPNALMVNVPGDTTRALEAARKLSQGHPFVSRPFAAKDAIWVEALSNVDVADATSRFQGGPSLELKANVPEGGVVNQVPLGARNLQETAFALGVRRTAPYSACRSFIMLLPNIQLILPWHPSSSYRGFIPMTMAALGAGH